MRRRDDDDDPRPSGPQRPTPGVVIGAVASGTVPMPFLAIYAVLFIVHGTVHPVAPPDITATKQGELVAGITAAVIFAVSILALVWVVNGHRRWPFALVELGMLGSALYFLIDGTKGGTVVSALVAATAALAVGLIMLPSAAAHYRLPVIAESAEVGAVS